jgi:hypothetical protein
MGIEGLSNFQEGGQMQDHEGETPDVPQEEMTAAEREQAGLDNPDDMQEAEADQVQAGHEASGEGDDSEEDDDESDPAERTDDPAPVPDDSLPDDGDPEVDGLESEPIPKEDFEQGELSDHGETREEPADLSGVEKEFED